MARIDKIYVGLMVLVMLSILLSGCADRSAPIQSNENGEVEFPVDADGIPKENKVAINGEVFTIEGSADSGKKCEIELDCPDDRLFDILIPEMEVGYEWCMEEKPDLEMISYEENVAPKVEKKKIGGNGMLQRFRVCCCETKEKEIRLKWCQYLERGKRFDEKEAAFELIIHFKE